MSAEHSSLNQPPNIKQMNKAQNIRIEALTTQPLNVVVGLLLFWSICSLTYFHIKIFERVC